MQHQVMLYLGKEKIFAEKAAAAAKKARKSSKCP